MAIDDPVQATVILSMVIILAGVAFLEIRLIRSRRRKKEARGDLPDRAHNVLLSVKAIADAVGRAGVRSLEADDLIREAEKAFESRNYRVSVELAERAKAVLRQEKSQYQAKGDLTKLDSTKVSGDVAPTTKEKLTKELPPNFMQAQFSMKLARDEIEGARSRGQDVREAERALSEVQAMFDAKDYNGALSQSSRVRRSLEGKAAGLPPIPATSPVPVSSVSTPKSRRCPSCGADVPNEDAFCRKCGAQVPRARACPSCGTEVASDDAFCRKCGTKVL